MCLCTIIWTWRENLEVRTESLTGVVLECGPGGGGVKEKREPN